jgi:hypothetical protein
MDSSGLLGGASSDALPPLSALESELAERRERRRDLERRMHELLRPIEERAVSAAFLRHFAATQLVDHAAAAGTAQQHLSVRDVHRLVIVPATQQRAAMVRYVELEGVSGGADPATGSPYVGAATHFVSYSWDSPWETLLDALVTHSRRDEAEGKPVPYYWIDQFGLNQHDVQACHVKAAGGCPGCLAVAEDMEPDAQGKRGFERVIAHTRHTLQLNEPWDDPRPPKRAWCLFEGYMTLRQLEGRLEVVLGRRQERQLQLQLGERFNELAGVVGSIDARLAEATKESDRTLIFAAVDALDGGFDRLNEGIRNAQQRWLVQAAEGILGRTEAGRVVLPAAMLAAENADRPSVPYTPQCYVRGVRRCDTGWDLLLERWPRLEQGLFLVGAAMACASFGIDSSAQSDADASGSGTNDVDPDYVGFNATLAAWALCALGWAFAALAQSLADEEDDKIHEALLKASIRDQPGLHYLLRATALLGHIVHNIVPSLCQLIALFIMLAPLSTHVSILRDSVLNPATDRASGDLGPQGVVVSTASVLLLLGWLAHRRRQRRQLRAPALGGLGRPGRWLSPQASHILGALVAWGPVLSLLVCAMNAGESTDGACPSRPPILGSVGMTCQSWHTFVSLVSVFMLAIGLLRVVLVSPALHELQRSRLLAQVAWARLQLDEPAAAVSLLQAAHARLHALFGCDDCRAWRYVAPTLVCALDQAKMHEAAQDLLVAARALAERNEERASGRWQAACHPSWSPEMWWLSNRRRYPAEEWRRVRLDLRAAELRCALDTVDSDRELLRALRALLESADRPDMGEPPGGGQCGCIQLSGACAEAAGQKIASWIYTEERLEVNVTISGLQLLRYEPQWVEFVARMESSGMDDDSSNKQEWQALSTATARKERKHLASRQYKTCCHVGIYVLGVYAGIFMFFVHFVQAMTH